MDRSRVGIVIPALNESGTIACIVEAAKKYGIPIVVDDGSTDNTAELARQSGALVVSHEFNQGYDAALDSGFKKASEFACEVIVTLDADGQHDSNLINRFIERVDAGAKVVVGVRSSRQRLAEHVFAWYTRSRFGIDDPLCGMKAFKASVYRELGHFDSYGSIGTELLIFAAKNDYRIDQIPFKVRDRLGESRFGHVFSANYKIFRAMIYSFYVHNSYIE
jgi:glycosyltransferase involved in cell wall biosynthesis